MIKPKLGTNNTFRLKLNKNRHSDKTESIEEPFYKLTSNKHNKYPAKKLEVMGEAAMHHLNENEITKALSLYDSMLKVHEELYGKNSAEFYHFFNQLLLNLNSHGLKQ